MYVTVEQFNDTPVFRLQAVENPAWRRVFGATWINGQWTFPAYYPYGYRAKEDLKLVAPGAQWAVEASEQAARLDQEQQRMQLLEAQHTSTEVIQVDMPADFPFYLTPYRHQLYGLQRALLNWRDFFLWEMGTGKTKVMVELFRLLRRQGQFRRALVIAPPVVLPTWEREVLRHAAGELSTLFWQPKAGRRKELYRQAQQADIVVLSYARARHEIEGFVAAQHLLRMNRAATEEQRKGWQETLDTALESLPYDIIVADESQNLANPNSGQTKACLRFSSKAARRYCLTGTPGDRPDQLYAQLRFLSPALMPLSFADFCAKHLRYHASKPYLVVGYRRMDAINELMSQVSTRAKKEDCLDLPPVTIQDIRVHPRPAQIARYNELVSEMKASLTVDLRYLVDPSAWEDDAAQQQAMLNLPHAAVRVIKLLQVASGFLTVGPDRTICDNCIQQEHCVEQRIKPYTQACPVVQEPPPTVTVRDFGNPKLETFEYYVEQILEGDSTNKILCWGTFLTELDDMEALAKKKGWGYVRVDGSNTSHIKKYEDAFQGDPKCRLYIGQVASGVGVTLTAANYAVYYALPWNRIHYRQSLERNNRPGQTRPMTVYRLMVQGTLDEFIAKLLSHKDLVAYTLTEKVTCTPCSRALLCAETGVRPFRKDCIYQANRERPIAAATLIRGR